MSEKTKQAGSGLLSSLTEREQLLVKVMGGVFVVLFLFLVIGLSQRSVSNLEEQTIQYQAALDLLTAQGPAFAAAQSEGDSNQAMTRADLFTEEVLRDNPVSLMSFTTTHVSAIDLSVASYNPGERAIGSSRPSDGGDDDGPVIIERELTLDIRNADQEDLFELLHRIEESREPVVTKSVDMRSVRDEGKLRAIVVLATYEYSTSEEES